MREHMGHEWPLRQGSRENAVKAPSPATMVPLSLTF
jgi:hypothetical protein